MFASFYPFVGGLTNTLKIGLFSPYIRTDLALARPKYPPVLAKIRGRGFKKSDWCQDLGWEGGVILFFPFLDQQ